MKTKTALILILTLSAAQAAADRLNISIASHHFAPLAEAEFESERSKNGGKYNERNPGIGWETPLDADQYLIAGVYKDSFGDPAVYAGTGLDFYRAKHLSLCGEAAFVFGPNNYAAALLCARVRFSDHGIKIGYAPAKSAGGRTDIATIQYQFYFD